MEERNGAFSGDNPFEIARNWLREAEETEPNDANAMALATVDPEGFPNVRMVLLKDIANDSFVFYTNYKSAKAREIENGFSVAFVVHWKSLRRQIRVRGTVKREEGDEADEYFASRSLQSRYGAWASRQSEPISSRGELVAKAARMAVKLGPKPKRPPFWGGYRIFPFEIEFWKDGPFRLHDRFRWSRRAGSESWTVARLSP